jgi:acetyl esterase/lipase
MTLTARSRRLALTAIVAVGALVLSGCWAPTLTSSNQTYEVVVTSNLVYGRGEVAGGGSFVDLKLDLYTPQDTEQAELPLVVVVHGGGFVSGSKTQQNVVAWSRAFAERGYLVASIDYRLSGTNPVPSERVAPLYDVVLDAGGTAQQVAAVAAVDDTLMALDYLLARPESADASTVLVGGSAGAITVDNVAYALDDVGIERPTIRAVISNWGGLPLVGADALIDNPTPTLANPYSEPPVFLSHATGDPTVSYSLSVDMAEAAEARGLDHVLYTKNASVHGFDLAAETFSPGRSVLDAQIDFATCAIYSHVAEQPDCAGF